MATFSKNLFALLKRSTVVFGLLSLVLLIGGCGSSPVSPDSISMQSFSTENYASDWQEVEKFEGKGLPKSSLEVVQRIYAQAKADNNPPQMVKALIHQLKYVSATQEGDLMTRIEELEEEVKTTEFPVTPVLYSLLGEMYQEYYQQNLYRFRGGHRMEDVRNLIATAQKYYDLSVENRDQLKSLPVNLYDPILMKEYTGSQGEVYRTSNTESREIDGRIYRPTLYDFLAHRALDFYAQQDVSMIYPSDEALFDNEDYFNPIDGFTELQLVGEDFDEESGSFKLRALVLFQDLLRFHQQDSDKSALIDVDLKRLAFVHQYFTPDRKDVLYIRALNDLIKVYEGTPLSGKAKVALAWHYYNQSQNYDPLNPVMGIIGNDGSTEKAAISMRAEVPLYRYDAVSAYNLCEETIKDFPQSNAALQAEYLRSLITAKDLAFTLEEVNLPDQAFRGLLQFRNLEQVFVRVIKVNRDEIEKLQKKHENHDEYLKALVEQYRSYEPVETLTVNLTDINAGGASAASDYQSHSAEIKLSPLAAGDYLVMVGSDEGMSYEKNAVAYAFTSVSRISLVNRNRDDGSTEVYLLDRLTGQPLSGAIAQVWQQAYGFFGAEKYDKKESFTANEEGYFLIPKVADSRSFYLEIRAPQFSDDVFVTKALGDYYGSNFYQYQPYHEQRSWAQAFLFTDRSIYRPGQPVYFKGLLLNMTQDRTVENSEIAPNTPVNVVFYDVNNQKVEELNLKTNEFGSFNGSFITPVRGLNGQMRLEVSTPTGGVVGSFYFSVEDYKRPSFEVTFDPVEDAFALHDTVTVNGKALAYAGAPLTNAKVYYKVLRTVHFPLWWSWQRGYSLSIIEPKETLVSSGTAVTDKDGNFTIEFEATPDQSIAPLFYEDAKPISHFKVVADVTDIQGETRSGETMLRIGEQEFELSTTVPDKLELESQQKFGVQALNLNGVAQEVDAKVQVIQLEAPVQPLRTRLWQRPDIFLMTQDEYKKHFPYDIYNNEDDFHTWPQKQVVFETTVKTSSKDAVEQSKDALEQKPLVENLNFPDLSNWQPGTYMILVTAKDNDGTEVKDVRYVTVYDGLTSRPTAPLPLNTFDWYVLKTPTVEPSNEASFILGSNGSAKALYEIEKNGEILHKEWLTLNNESKRFVFPIKEEHRGDVILHLTFVIQNTLYKHDEVIRVPYTNKELDIVFETFRDKLEPGTQEEWKIRIKGKQGEQVAAEMVAALYDASLDAIQPHQWLFNLFQSTDSRLSWYSQRGFRPITSTFFGLEWNQTVEPVYVAYDLINWFGFLNPEPLYPPVQPLPRARGGVSFLDFGAYQQEGAMAPASTVADEATSAPQGLKEESAVLNGNVVGERQQDRSIGTPSQQQGALTLQPRRNFVETAFFYPELRTDADGAVIVSFTLPDALTRWKMLGFAHTQDLKYGLIEKELVSQKKLMVASYAPRFFREGDTITLMAKITNTSDVALDGTVKLELFDALTMKPLSQVAQNFSANDVVESAFQVDQGQNTSAQWTFVVPEGIQAITYRVSGSASNFVDAEEMTVPVLTNRMLVTETLPLHLRGAQTKTFELQKLLTNNSTTLRNHALTLEYTSNPIWYAVQSLPYLIEYPYECSEQIFSRFYANSMARHIIEQHPQIKTVFDQWRNYDTEAFLSNLEKNPELKSVLIEETPWVRDAGSEEEQRKRIALLFDFNAMQYELDDALQRLEALQLGDGSWPWFEGMDGDRYITQHIVAGFGHLQKLGVIDIDSNPRVQKMILKAMGYLDKALEKDYDRIRTTPDAGIENEDRFFDPSIVHALYTRSFFLNIPRSAKTEEAFQYFSNRLKTTWAKQDNIYLQGMFGLALIRMGESETAFEIIASLRERAIHNDEMGMYWKTTAGYYWYEAPIERQALMIEFFTEAKDLHEESERSEYQTMVDDMKIWLLKQKQTQSWPSTKATTEALYALLLQGSNWLQTANVVEISVGDTAVSSDAQDPQVGTGYMKTSWSGNEITNDMGKVTVKQDQEGISWGALYWQYFEDLDKITTSQPTALKVEKELWIQDELSDDATFSPLEQNTLQVGDLVKVRLLLETDRDMEYVHLKDMRAAGLEPIDVLSGCRYQDGLCFYQTTRDTATHFFFNRLPKGKYVIEYLLRVSHAGDFSNGITSIENMYAPEFAGHTKGVRLKVEEQNL